MKWLTGPDLVSLKSCNHILGSRTPLANNQGYTNTCETGCANFVRVYGTAHLKHKVFHVGKCNAELLYKQVHMICDGLLRV